MPRPLYDLPLRRRRRLGTTKKSQGGRGGEKLSTCPTECLACGAEEEEEEAVGKLSFFFSANGQTARKYIRPRAGRREFKVTNKEFHIKAG